MYSVVLLRKKNPLCVQEVMRCFFVKVHFVSVNIKNPLFYFKIEVMNRDKLKWQVQISKTLLF